MLSALFSTSPLPFRTFHYNSLHNACAPHHTRLRRSQTWNKTYFTMSDQGASYTLSLQLPELSGRQLDDLELSVEGDVLTLNIPELTLSTTEGLKPLWEEIPSSSRREQFRIPSTVNTEEISAALKEERLEINLPKRAPIKHTINIDSNIAS